MQAVTDEECDAMDRKLHPPPEPEVEVDKPRRGRGTAKQDAPKTRPTAAAELEQAAATMQAVADEHVRVPSDELPAETRVEFFALGRGTYARVERRLMRADRHWVRFDGAGGAELALTG
jgi:hypothetical protein